MEVFPGILDQKTLSKLGKLTFSKEEKYILKLISNITQKFKISLIFRFIYLTALTSIGIFLLLFLDLIKELPQQSITILIVLYTIMAIPFSVFIIIPQSQNLNLYSRYISHLLDKEIAISIDRFRLSLAEKIPRIPHSKEISHDLGLASFSITEISDLVSYQVGIVLSIVAFLLLHTNKNVTTTLALIITEVLVIISIILILLLGKRFSKRSSDLLTSIDYMDQQFNDSQPTILPTTIGLKKSEYLQNVNRLASETGYINLIQILITNILPVCTLFLPLLGYDKIVPAITLFLILKAVSLLRIVSLTYNISAAVKRKKELDSLLNQIGAKTQEITPNRYLTLQSNKCITMGLQKRYKKLYKNAIIIKNLKYVCGRKEKRYRVSVPEMILPKSKISFLIGRSGSGKSVLGRVITMRYADFTAEFIGDDKLDFRCFPSLYEAQKVLHFSGLRNIQTSYRNAFSIFISHTGGDSLFKREILDSNVTINQLLKYLDRNRHYYKGTSTVFNRFIQGKTILSKQQLRQSIRCLKEKPQSYQIAWSSNVHRIFRSINHKENLEKAMNLARKKLREDDFQALINYCLKAEQVAFTHLKRYIPEASLYFMDAILSEPPISQGQRRRILFALDISLQGILFVIDEPSCNLDLQTSMYIFNDLSRYAKTYSAAVLVLDQKLLAPIIKTYRNQNVLGNMYGFKKVNKGYAIKKIQEEG